VSLRYRADLQTAAERVDRSTDILDRAGFDDSIIEQVRDLHRWLADFPQASMVELDYSSVSELFSAAELAFDDSAAQVRSSLEALDELDYETAGELYSAVAGRWAPVQALTYVN